MAHAPHNPSSNPQDKARMGNAKAGDRSATRAGTSRSTAPDGRGQQRASGAQAGAERIGDVMTRDVRLTSPELTIREAAVAMADADIGSLPVGENDRLIGMITDRDIALRAVAKGRSPDTTVREIMTERIQYCYEDDSIDDVARHMADLGVRRLPVINRDKRLVGIVALSNITHCGDARGTEVFLDGVAAPH